MNPAMPILHFRQIANGTILQAFFLNPEADTPPSEWPPLLQRYFPTEQEAA